MVDVFDQVFIRVGGPPGGGKTTFIKAVLADQAEEPALILVRRRRDDPSAPDPELVDVLAAMDEDCDVAIDEGHEPGGSPDLTVHVMAASAGPVLERRQYESEDARLTALLDQSGLPRGYTDLLASRGQILKKVLLDAPPAVCWAIPDEHRGIARSHLVIVNVRGGAERDRAEALVADVARLRRDPEVFADLRLSLVGGRTSITAVVADLADPQDAGTRKALARVRRVLRSRLVHG